MRPIYWCIMNFMDLHLIVLLMVVLTSFLLFFLVLMCLSCIINIGSACAFPTGDSFLEQMYPDAGKHPGRDVGILAAFFVLIEVCCCYQHFSPSCSYACICNRVEHGYYYAIELRVCDRTGTLFSTSSPHDHIVISLIKYQLFNYVTWVSRKTRSRRTNV
jgi:hypothetical protein